MKVRQKPKAFPPVEPREVLQGYIEPARKETLDSHREQASVLVQLKDEVYEQSMGILQKHLRFHEIDPFQPMSESPAFKKMLEEFGSQEKAEQAWRLAESGWRTNANAPSGIKTAMSLAIGIMKAAATEKGGTKVFNVDKVLIDASLIPQFEEKDVE